MMTGCRSVWSLSPELKALRASVVVGVVSAIVVWTVVYSVFHEPNPRRLSNAEWIWVSHADNNEVMRASAWAAITYVLTFAPTLLLLNRRILRSPFQKTPAA